MPDRDDSMDQAIAWHLRLRDATRGEWTLFVDWLEAAPEHAQAYDRLTLDDDLLANPVDLRTGTPEPANDPVTPATRPWRLRMAAGAATLGLVLATGVALLRPAAPASDRYMVATAPGEQRDVRLAGGTRIDLNGGTRLWLDRVNPRFARLDAGEAVFHVHHDAAAPFALQVGATQLRDLGTVFNVARDGRRLQVEVAEGAVMFRPDREAVVLRSGTQLTLREDLDRVTIGRVDAAAVGSWHHGLLVASDMPVASVAAAVERATAARLVVAPALADMPFTGSISLEGRAQTLVPRVARLLDVRWARDKGVWRLYPRDHGPTPD